MPITSPEDEKALGNLQFQVQELRTTLESLQVSHTALKRIEASTRANVLELETQKINLTADIESRKTEQAVLQSQNEKARKELEDAKNESYTLLADAQRVMQDALEQKRQAEALEKSAEATTSALNARQKQIDSDQETLEQSKKEHNEKVGKLRAVIDSM